VRIEQAGQQTEIAADSVVLAVGTRACNPLQKLAAELQLPCQVVGDAQQPAMVFDAVHQGFAAGRSLA
jgi:2,4-dienoyl-CoA reductase (NADPH2)